MRLGPAVAAFLLLTAVGEGIARTATQVPVYFGIHPGRSNKAEVDLSLGEPRARIADGIYEYVPPKNVADTAKVVVSYSQDTRQVLRVDVYLKTPLSADLLRDRFGTRVLVRDRKGGGQEEIYYPTLHALVFSSKSADAPVDAIGYLSTRLLHGIYVERAREQLREKRYDEAMTDAEKALVVDADYAGAYVAQGDILMARKNVDEAIVRYLAGTNARYSTPAKGLAYARLGEAYWFEKKWADKAEAAHREAARIAPDLGEAHYEYGRFLRTQKRDDEALPKLVRALELDPGSLNAHFSIADLYWDRQRFKEALPHYEALQQWADAQVKAAWNTVRQVYQRYGYCVGESGEPDKAIKAFEKIVEREPNNADAWYRMGIYTQKAGALSTGVEHHRRAVTLQPGEFWHQRGLVRALLQAGRHEEALRQAELSLTLEPKDSRRMVEIARCHALTGKKGKANDWIEKAIGAGFNSRQELLADPAFESLRDNGGFKSLLKKLP